MFLTRLGNSSDPDQIESCSAGGYLAPSNAGCAGHFPDLCEVADVLYQVQMDASKKGMMVQKEFIRVSSWSNHGQSLSNLEGLIEMVSW